MSAARRAARAGRNLLTALLVGAVIIVAIVVAYVAGRGSGATSTAPSNNPASASAPPSPSNSAVTADSAPTGCLGGEGRTNAMLLNAQKAAPHSTYGAVEVATAFYRWSYRYPVPSEADVRAIDRVFVPGESGKAEVSLIDDYARNPNPSGDVVKDGTGFYLSTATGRWTAQAADAAGDELISVQATFVIDGVLSATETTTEAFNMRWVSGEWRIVGVAKFDPAKIAAGGTAFTAGC